MIKFYFANFKNIVGSFLLTIAFAGCAYSQCNPVATMTVGISSFVCSEVSTPSYGMGYIKFNLGALIGSYNYKFSTFGQSVGDTQLYLYKRDGTLISTNDDNVIDNAYPFATKQSVLYFTPAASAADGDYYVVLSKANCQSLDFDVILQYSVSNETDNASKIIEPLGLIACVSSSNYKLTYNGEIKNGSWKSSDSSVASISAALGIITFKKEGFVKISVETPFSCEVIKNYKVVETKTTAITHN
jgi:hypothetical protein